jgi:hypothetical protein
VALRTCLCNGLGLEEYIVYAASYNAYAVADVTDEVLIVVKSSNVLRYEIYPRSFLISLDSWYSDACKISAATG